MRIMGLDVGEKTIGVAISDELGLTAQGLEVIRRTSHKQDITRLNTLIVKHNVDKIVIGMPRRTDGSYGPEADKITKFASELKEVLGLTIEYQDERFSTVAAERVLLEADLSRKRRKEVVDKVAAAVILQSYLDRT